MNWRCLFGKHEWGDNFHLPFTEEKLRKCGGCSKMQIWTDVKGWVPFEGMTAVIGLSFALGEMKRRIQSSTPEQS